MLPDDVLLVIFDLYVKEIEVTNHERAWQTLVHVCPRWRSVVFGSPRFLNLRLVCGSKTLARGTLDVWPALLLVVRCLKDVSEKSVDSIVAVLERGNRVCQIELNASSLHFQNVSAAMQKPFPELTQLKLSSFGPDRTVPVLPDSFLGGSAPRLRILTFHGVPFPGLPKLLLSATRLVTLRLSGIPHSGYILPEVMITALSTLICLESFSLEFRFTGSHPGQASRRPPSPTRFVLPALTCFKFGGVSEYFDSFVAHIDAPLLIKLEIAFNQTVVNAPQLIQFISRTPRLNSFESAHVAFSGHASSVTLSLRPLQVIVVSILCPEMDRPVSSLEQVCSSCFPPHFMLEDLYISGDTFWTLNWNWQDNTENSLWLGLLRHFTTVKNLYVSKIFARRIVLTLQELVGARTTEVLPALKNIFLEGLEPSGPVREGIEQFVATRQVTSHPVAVSRWKPYQGR